MDMCAFANDRAIDYWISELEEDKRRDAENKRICTTYDPFIYFYSVGLAYLGFVGSCVDQGIENVKTMKKLQFQIPR